MFVNRYQINVNTYSSGATDSYFNIPITMEYQIVDQTDIVKRVFVDVETEKAINPIVDYEKVRFMPLDMQGNKVPKVIYNVILSAGTTYGSVGFDNDDIKLQKETFKQTFLNLNFFDSDNPLSQNLVTNITLFSQLKSTDLYPFGSTNGIPGQPLKAIDIPLSFALDNSMLNQSSFLQGYFIYDYKDEIVFNDYKYLYMRANFNNAKNGKSTNLMVKNAAQPIDTLVHELYTRYKLERTQSGFYYKIDDTYQGNTGVTGTNNVTYSNNTVTVNLYQILAL
jgi:hypothetical protein